MQRQGAGDLDAATVGVGQRGRGLVQPWRQPVAEQRDEPRHLVAQRLLLADHRGRAEQRHRQFGQRAQAGHARLGGAQAVMRANQDVVAHRHRREHAAMLEGAGETHRGDALRHQPGDRLSLQQDRAGIRPVMAADQVNSVVLPAPFGPMIDSSSPSASASRRR